MIGSFSSKPLKRLWEKGDASGIDSAHLARVRRILVLLDTATELDELDLPGLRLHMLRGFEPIRYAVRISANWRITFQWLDDLAEHIDYEDYH